MADSTQFGAEATNTVDVIMQSTYHVLLEHGYAGLSIARIADEAGLSKSALYNHYEGKNDLLLDFLSRFLEWYLDSPLNDTAEDPRAELQRLIDLLSVDSGGADSSTDSTLETAAADAFVELRAQAIHDESFRTELLREDEVIRTRLVQIIQQGINDGVFLNVDPEPVAEFILTVLEGALFRSSLSDDGREVAVYDRLDEYIKCQLVLSTAGETP
ncbi:TetR/AcrR family transcriptional regulator (plasmid) [Natrinema zhouii]|uniref:TetR/AcrR family transcriptional regulator n=1 Tax=Natrinema zhouii TaxID=1710539 RepID=UPI001CFFF151|nr:TetR/AcrR family transcriptional regulator [Natrinema zhouii]UHQ99004.1 TetR/AcrR family transcriptional regulator [Natrinema zhouii]